MRFTYHIGLHCTDEDRALDCLLANAGALARQGCAIAPPDRFRPALREAMLELKGAPAPAAMQERLLDAVTDMDAPAHVLFSSDSFLCVPRRAVADGTLYPLAEERAPWIRNLFPRSSAHFALALRNPATLLPALQARFRDSESWGDFLGRIRPEALSWAEMVARLRAAVPDAEITVWCNEDAALLWPDLLALLAATDDGAALEGHDAFLGELMTPQGLARMRSYLAENPPQDAGHRRRITAAFLDRFARPEAVEEEFDLAGWSADRLARLTERYEADLARIDAMEDVRLLRP
jgi:hypothetical protein